MPFGNRVRTASEQSIGLFWIEAATASHFRFLAQFANTLRRDLKAVTLHSNPGMTDVCFQQISGL
jgi:hypothetical protein